MNYEDAIRLPKNGAVYLKEPQLLAVVARSTGERLAMNPKVVYDWAVSQNLDSMELGLMGRTTESASALLVAILNKEPLS